MITRPRLGMLALSHGQKRDGNIGAAIIHETLHRGGYDIDWITPEQYDSVDMMLVSLPSTYQVADYVRVARRHRFDRRRRARILVGGYGMQNPHPMQEFMDWGFVGRAHDIVCDMIAGLLRDGDYPSDSLLPPTPRRPVVIRQAPLLSDSHVMREQFTGCNLKCKFCHYTYARKYTGGDNPYIQTMLSDSAPEMLMAEIPKLTAKQGRLRTAIDGFSERLRYLYGKRISDDLIVQSINHLGALSAAESDRQGDMFGGGSGRPTVAVCYNIANFPGETPEDEAAFASAVQRAAPRAPVIFIVHTTPFRPSPATPMQWEPVSLWPQWSDARERVIVRRDNLLVKYSYTLEGAWSHLVSIMVERARPQDADMIAAAVGWRPDLSSAERVRSFLDAHDISHHLAEHDIDGPSPTWWLGGYISDHLIRRIARKMRATRRQWDAPGAGMEAAA